MNTLDGEIHYNFTPINNDPYYVLLPKELSTTSNEISLTINGQPLTYRQKFRRDQLINLASQAEGEPQNFVINLKSDKSYDLTKLQIVRVNTSSINNLIEDLQDEAITVENWNANSIKGTITIKDSPWVLTSIPYDDSWEVKVNEETVEIEEVWDSLLAFKVEPGDHIIEMTYKPNGLTMGVGISSFTSILFLSIWYLSRRKAEDDRTIIKFKRG